MASHRGVWLPLVDEPIGTIVAQIQRRASRRSPGWWTRRASCSPFARSPTSASASCSAACSSSTTSSPTRARDWAEQLLQRARSTTAEVVRRGRRGRPGDRRRPRVCGRLPVGPSEAERARFAEFAKQPPERGLIAQTGAFSQRRRSLLIMRGRWGSGSRASVLLGGSPRARSPARRGAGGAGSTAGASARAFAIRVVVPGQAGAESGSISCAARPRRLRPELRLPGRRLGRHDRLADAPRPRATRAPRRAASASSEVQSLILFGGEITPTLVKGAATRARRRAAPRSGDFSGAGDLVADGARRGRAGRPNGRIALGRLGLPHDPRAGHRHELRRRRRAGLPRLRHRARRPPDRAARRPPGRLGDPGRLRGGERAGQRRAAAQAGRARAGGQAARAREAEADAGRAGADHARQVTPLLRKARRPPAAADGGRLRLPGLRPVVVRRQLRRVPRRRLRQLAPRRRHLRARSARRSSPAPTGIVFSVGWNDVGGNRLWLRDSPGQRVLLRAPLRLLAAGAERGTSRRARCSASSATPATPQGTPTHLHFEVHPTVAALHGLRRRGRPDAVPGRLAAPPGRALLGRRELGRQTGIADPAPKPAAILLQVSDISEASGLEPGSLQRAMSARAPWAPRTRWPSRSACGATGRLGLSGSASCRCRTSRRSRTPRPRRRSCPSASGGSQGRSAG